MAAPRRCGDWIKEGHDAVARTQDPGIVQYELSQERIQLRDTLGHFFHVVEDRTGSEVLYRRLRLQSGTRQLVPSLSIRGKFIHAQFQPGTTEGHRQFRIAGR